MDAKLRDRLAASMINAKLPYMYSTSAVGFVLSATELQGTLWCSYPRDGNSMSLAEHGCASTAQGIGSFKYLERMLIFHMNHLKPSSTCLWGKPDATDRSDCRYNEVVLDGAAYAARLPAAVEAIFFPEHGPVHHAEGDEARAKALHAAFGRAFAGASVPSSSSRSSSVGGGSSVRGNVPLLAFDVAKARSGLAPFREVRV